jgi:thymidylate kinase
MDRIVKEPLSFHSTVTEGYRVQARKHARRIKVIDAVGPADSVLQAGWKEIEHVLLESGL